MLEVLITGSEGQLGHELLRTAPDDAQVAAIDVDTLDITDGSAVGAYVAALRPQVVIHTAAYTAVDRAESERDTAFRVNADGAENLALGCQAVGARMIQISTDFVFAGDRSTPYPVDAEPDPRSVYGASKLEGERRVLDTLGERATVVRTSWLYSRFGTNFALTMLRLFGERDWVKVIDDQTGTPTWAHTLANALWEIAGDETLSGIFHWSDLGVASWYDFAQAVLEEGTALGLVERSVALTPIPSRDYPTPAARPSFSVLDKHATLARLQTKPLHWRQSLRAMLQDHRTALS